MRRLYSFTKGKGKEWKYTISMNISENPLMFTILRGGKTMYSGYDSVRATNIYESLINNY